MVKFFVVLACSYIKDGLDLHESAESESAKSKAKSKSNIAKHWNTLSDKQKGIVSILTGMLIGMLIGQLIVNLPCFSEYFTYK